MKHYKKKIYIYIYLNKKTKEEEKKKLQTEGKYYDLGLRVKVIVKII